MNKILKIIPVIFLFFCFNPYSNAAVFFVGDEASFQSALDTASSNGEDDEILLVGGTFLTNGSTFTYTADAVEDFSLTITGSGVNQTILDGGGADQILVIDMSAVVNADNIDLEISSITFVNGNSVADGGGLHVIRPAVVNTDPLTVIEGCEFIDNIAGERGGGISFDGSSGIVNIHSSFFSGNESTGGNGGGAFVNSAAQEAVVSDNIFINNSSVSRGGGLRSGAQVVTLSDNIFSGNTASGEGGGASVGSGGLDAVITENIFQDNASGSEGGGLRAGGGGANVQLENNSFIDNVSADDGGGTRVSGGGLTALMRSNIFFGNQTSATGGGSHISGGGATAVLNNNIFVSNSASEEGGGTAIRGGGISVNINNNTYTLNSSSSNGGGIAVISLSDSDSTIFSNNIVFDNSAAGNGSDIFVADDEDENDIGSMISLFSNIFSDFDTTCLSNSPPCVPDVTETDTIDLDPLFVDVQNAIVTLFEGSPAIDTGNNLVCPPVDQRGVARPQDGNNSGIAICDIGAIEMTFAELEEPPAIESGSSGCTLAAKGTSSLPNAFISILFIAMFTIYIRRMKGRTIQIHDDR